MDGALQVRISFWTYWLDPLMVAVSKDVFSLMRYFPESYAFGMSSKYIFKMSHKNRMLGINLRCYFFLKYLIPIVERQFDVNHVHSYMSDWHFLNVLGRRPIILTLTSRSSNAAPTMIKKLSHVVAQSENLVKSAIETGIEPDRVSLIYPGVDLVQFREAPPLPKTYGVWKCLFASSPEDPTEIHTKGLDLLLDLAASEPRLSVTILWRPFGKLSDAALSKVRGRGLSNVTIHEGRIADIQTIYGRFHFTIAPFRTVGKSCPNSIIESLAVGRPVLVSRFVDIADLLERERSGLSFDSTIEALRERFRVFCDRYDTLQQNARACAEKFFDLNQTVKAYRDLYARFSPRS